MRQRAAALATDLRDDAVHGGEVERFGVRCGGNRRQVDNGVGRHWTQFGYCGLRRRRDSTVGSWLLPGRADAEEVFVAAEIDSAVGERRRCQQRLAELARGHRAELVREVRRGTPCRPRSGRRPSRRPAWARPRPRPSSISLPEQLAGLRVVAGQQAAAVGLEEKPAVADRARSVGEALLGGPDDVRRGHVARAGAGRIAKTLAWSFVT